jgi:effector-binding domain-containing protein
VLRSLDALLLAPERVRYDVAIAEREPLRLVGVTGPVRADALDVDTAALCAAVLRSGAGHGREPLVGVFPLDLVEEFDASVGVPASAATSDAVVVLPGGPWAATLHVGPYEELPFAYTALLEHVREHGHQAQGPVTETYLTDPSTAAPEELVTRVAMALEP